MAGTIEKSFLFAIALFALALPHAGWADGPSLQKITETIQIDAAPAKVWATIANFHDMSRLPGVAKTTGEGGNEPDVAKRQLSLDSGATIDESLIKYDAAEMSYSYRIDKVDVKVLPVNDYSATITAVLWRNCHKKSDHPASISAAWQKFAQSRRFAQSERKS